MLEIGVRTKFLEPLNGSTVAYAQHCRPALRPDLLVFPIDPAS